MHHATSLHANHIRRVHECLAVTFHPHIWQNDQVLLHATLHVFVSVRVSVSAVARGWNGYRPKSRSAQKVDTGEEHSPSVPTGTRTRDFSIMSSAL